MRVPLSLSLTVLGLLAGLTMPQGALLAQTTAKDGVVATIDGKPITEKDLELAYEELAASLPPQVSDAQKRDYAISYLADIKAGAQAAIAAKLDQGEDYLRRLN